MVPCTGARPPMVGAGCKGEPKEGSAGPAPVRRTIDTTRMRATPSDTRTNRYVGRLK